MEIVKDVVDDKVIKLQIGADVNLDFTDVNDIR